MTDADGAVSAVPSGQPDAARRWLARSLPPGPIPTEGQVRLRLRGAVARRPGAAPMPWEGRQAFDIGRPGFRWLARIRLARFVWLDAEDRLDDAGFGGASLWAVLPIVRGRGPEVTRSQLVRNLAELALAPVAAAGCPDLAWAEDGPDAFLLTAPAHDPSAAVRFTVSGDGDLLTARADARPREVPGGFVEEPYRLELSGHATVDNARIPTAVRGVFQTAAGDWPYWRVEMIGPG